MASTVWLKNKELLRKIRIAKAVMGFSSIEKLIEDMLEAYMEKNKERFILSGGKNGKNISWNQ